MDDRHLEHIERMLGLSKLSARPVEFSMRVNPAEDIFQSFSAELIRHGLFRLPYEQCIFYPSDLPVAFFAWHPSDEIIDVIVLSTHHGEPIHGVEFCNGRIADSSFGDPFIASAMADHEMIDAISGSGVNMNTFTARFVMGYIGALSTRGVVEQIIAPSQRNNEKLVKRGRRPIPERHVVYIDLERGAHTAEPLIGDKDRASPRPHWRRGHIRRLSSGDLVNVRPCIVAGAVQGGPKSYVAH